MSKIELTEQQTERLRQVWMVEATHRKALLAVANELVAMGLVRPATDDLEARVAALEAKVDRTTEVMADMAPQVEALQTPDPHAVAKERAKLWGVELVRVNQGKGGDLSFASKTQYWNMASWLPLGTTPVEEMYGFYKTTPEAWSNFPTEPPPGWEAKCEHANIVATTGDTHGQCVKCNRRVPKPRTEADRLGEVAWKADGGALEGDEWANDRDTSPARRQAYRTIAHAVRKAVLASQLEPSEEEVAKAFEAFSWRKHGPQGTLIDALKAAARVRLEKAEGEQ